MHRYLIQIDIERTKSEKENTRYKYFSFNMRLSWLVRVYRLLKDRR